MICDTVGTFIKGFYGATAQSNVLFAEIIVVLQGLQLRWENGSNIEFASLIRCKLLRWLKPMCPHIIDSRMRYILFGFC
jgi:hypothetical protein